jgi:hypothetical protein
MKLAKANLQRGDGTARLAPLEELGGRYVKFGTDVVVLADEAEYDGVAARAEQEGLPLDEFDSVDNREDMHVVRQMGAVFQLLHPDVEILYDKGRYLLVKMSPERAAELSAQEDPHYSPDFYIEPLEDNQTIFDVRVPGADRAAREPWVQQLVDAVSESGFEANLEHLVESFTTRFSPSGPFDEAVAWARSQLDAMGYATTVEPFTFGANETSQNLIAHKPGRGTGTRQLVIVCAHMDSINLQGGPEGPAPGADDNGSGFMGLLEMARVLKDHPAVHDLIFIGTGAEERGLFGSREYVDRLSPADRQRVKCVVNMDMIATVNGTPSPTVLLEGAPVSRDVIDDLAAAAATYTSLTVQTSEQAAASDHVPFIRANVPAVLTIEGTDSANHNVHTPNDKLVFINSGLAAEILRMNVAAVATAVGKEGETDMSENDTSLAGLFDTVGAAVNRELQRTQLSGRYLYNGEVVARQAADTGEGSAGARYATTTDPIFSPVNGAIDLPNPVDDSGASVDGGRRESLGFTLHLDIDGSYPLNVVSGTVVQDLPTSSGGSERAPFIGRVTSDTVTGGIRKLVVGDFSFRWPGTEGNGTIIDRLEVDLPTSFPLRPSLEVSFMATASDYRHGPYIVHQESTYFRTVEVEVDRENDAVEVEPYNTHTHPVRPADLPEEDLTLESVFDKAGIRITRSPNSDVIDTAEATGDNSRWNNQELHDAMEAHWSAFANRPQWKLWVFLAEHHENNGLGGIMFDADIAAPGGVDRQGTAIFTKAPYFHTPTGSYAKANPPEAEAVKRELMFNAVHEAAHAFNLFHSFEKTPTTAWSAPPWMPVRSNDQALSWMNYPDQATPYPAAPSAKWFYSQFRFRFEDSEHLFLRHAPEEFVEMANAAWGQSHARVAQADVDDRLKLEVNGVKQVFEWGEPVFVKLILRNITDQELLAQNSLDPGEGAFVEVAITNPQGERVPFLPVMQTRSEVQFKSLRPEEIITETVNVTVGQRGFPFTIPGMYRIEASYTNRPGGSAAAFTHVYVQEPKGEDALAAKDLFDARVGRVLLVNGTRMEDVNEKLDFVAGRLGEEHPTTLKLLYAQGSPYSRSFKQLGADASTVQLKEPEEEVIDKTLARITANQEVNAEIIGYEIYSRVVIDQANFLMTDGRPDEARQLATRTVDFYREAQEQGHIGPDVVEAMEMVQAEFEQ